MRAPPVGHRANHVVAFRLPPTQPPPRYERNPRKYLAFLGLAAALCRSKRLVRLTT